MNIGNKLGRLAAAGLLSVSFAVPAVLAQSPAGPQSGDKPEAREGKWRGGHHGRRHGRGGFMFAKLNLSDAQKAQFKQLRDSRRDAMTGLRNELRAKRQELRQAEQGGTFNQALATQKLTEIAPIQARLMAERFQIRQQMLALLTPEQKAQLDQWKAERQARKAERESRKS
jgi:Spy/CpxP family protein refolding chaperone